MNSTRIREVEEELREALAERVAHPNDVAVFWRCWRAHDAFDDVWRPLVRAGGVAPSDWATSWTRATGRTPGPGAASRAGWCPGRFRSRRAAGQVCNTPGCTGVACPQQDPQAAVA